MKRNHWNIKKRIMAGFVVVLAVVSVVVTLLFRQTENKLRVEYRKLVQSSVEGAMHRLDMLVREVYSISDYFAFNNQLERYLDKTYTDEQVHVKRADVMRMYRDFFEASDILQKRQKISGILTTKGVLFNFEDVNCDGPEVAEQLIALGINKPEHLMRFCWYPLRDNFMVQDAAGDVRKDKAVFGSRRVYSVWKSAYVCTHIFCIQEEDLYETYQESVVETKGEIYILDENCNLISSSNQECVQRGTVDETFRKKLLSRTEDDFTWKTRSENFEICVRQSEVNNWMTVAVIPQKNITGEVNALYLRIYVVLILCLIGCVVILLRMYQGFFTPVNELNQAMREVQMGNLNAYVKETGRNEIADMMRYYNNMLRSIHVHVVEKLESERRKKELELEVLVSQINPHFLYNTLENIVWKSNEAGHPDIGRFAAMLGRMYRLSTSGGQIIIPVKHEIEHLVAYTQIQKNRYGDAFDFDLRVDHEEIRKLMTLKIILQPIIENSFLHGMEGLDRKMKIRMKIRKVGDRLEIKLIDNGLGITKERLEKVRRKIHGEAVEEDTQNEQQRSSGIGLHNVAARITLYFGIDEPVKISSIYHVGTIIIVQIPILTKEDLDERGEYDLQNHKKNQ